MLGKAFIHVTADLAWKNMARVKLGSEGTCVFCRVLGDRAQELSKCLLDLNLQDFVQAPDILQKNSIHVLGGGWDLCSEMQQRCLDHLHLLSWCVCQTSKL